MGWLVALGLVVCVCVYYVRHVPLKEGTSILDKQWYLSLNVPLRTIDRPREVGTHNAQTQGKKSQT